jgi:hypothetical protein
MAGRDVPEKHELSGDMGMPNDKQPTQNPNESPARAHLNNSTAEGFTSGSQFPSSYCEPSDDFKGAVTTKGA